MYPPPTPASPPPTLYWNLYNLYCHLIYLITSVELQDRKRGRAAGYDAADSRHKRHVNQRNETPDYPGGTHM